MVSVDGATSQASAVRFFGIFFWRWLTPFLLGVLAKMGVQHVVFRW